MALSIFLEIHFTACVVGYLSCVLGKKTPIQICHPAFLKLFFNIQDSVDVCIVGRHDHKSFHHGRHPKVKWASSKIKYTYMVGYMPEMFGMK